MVSKVVYDHKGLREGRAEIVKAFDAHPGAAAIHACNGEYAPGATCPKCSRAKAAAASAEIAETTAAAFERRLQAKGLR